MHGKNVLACFVALSFFALFAATATAEQIDDPGYTYWAKFKPGSFSTSTTDSDLGDAKNVDANDDDAGCRHT